MFFTAAVRGIPYRIFGYKGKQVRDNIHSADVVSAFWAFVQRPSAGAVYNLGGERTNSTSLLEAIALLRDEHGLTLQHTYLVYQSGPPDAYFMASNLVPWTTVP